MILLLYITCMGGDLALGLGEWKIISLPHPEIFQAKFPNDPF